MEEGSSPPLLSSSSDEELDVASGKFNSLKALYSPRNRIDPDAPVYDNVDKFVAVQEGKIAKKTGRQASSGEAATPKVPLQRQFLPSQHMVQGHKKDLPNVLKYMSKQTSGPMSCLAGMVREGSRVEVCTRGLNGERGKCRAFLAAFDKHWNLALLDVDETFIRKRQGKEIASGQDKGEESKSTSVGPRKGEKDSHLVEWVGDSRVTVLKKKKKTLQCQRHIPQLLVRGEHVVFVRIL